MLIDRSRAILELIPNTEWHLVDDTLTVLTSGVETPTMAEIDAKVIEMQETAAAAKIAKEAELAQAKEELQVKLGALGLTENDFKALGL
jgi:uncharacterized protein YggE